MAREFEEIFQLMGGYLNQDMYLICNCDTLEEAIDYYVKNVETEVLIALLKELEKFDIEFPYDREQHFDEIINPEVDYISVDHLFGLIRSTIKKHYPDLIEFVK
ncbi:contact-dependent growth inhibition system immunity protein [Taylorella equigenitalis]|uniref:contact-dependent growth inhibition system immunity protein n=1 Tax=Taylorella equigenitalis TaxID=29575 RepID=UPI00237C724E|nr:contact-dependent growth inhibition system immunity protein [Taylorella equigenitalis]WDU55023.1 hypothetical protein KPZ19_00965 [Taylorella equigenitalis]